MKRIWIALSIVFFLIVACVLEVIKIKNATSDIQNKIETAEYYAKHDKQEESIKALDNVKQTFDNNCNLFNIFIPHNRVEEIRLAISSAKVSLESEEKEQFLLECTKAKINLKHLCETELVNLQNIL